jgi:hypothetical protein
MASFRFCPLVGMLVCAFCMAAAYPAHGEAPPIVIGHAKFPTSGH